MLNYNYVGYVYEETSMYDRNYRKEIGFCLCRQVAKCGLKLGYGGL